MDHADASLARRARMNDPRDRWSRQAPPFSYFLASTAIMFVAVLLFFCAGALFGAAALVAAPWVRVLLVIGGVLVVAPMCYLGWISGRRLRVDLHWLIYRAPLDRRRQRGTLSVRDHDARRSAPSAPAAAGPSLSARWADSLRIPRSETRLIRWYTVGIAGTLALLAVAFGDGVYAAVEGATGHSQRFASMPLWVVLALQVLTVVGAGSAVRHLRPDVAKLTGPLTVRVRVRLYCAVVFSAGLGLLLTRHAPPVLVVAIVGAASLLAVGASDLAAMPARHRGSVR